MTKEEKMYMIASAIIAAGGRGSQHPQSILISAHKIIDAIEEDLSEWRRIDATT